MLLLWMTSLLFVTGLSGEAQRIGITINTNAWSDAGHSVNQIYDILYMMGRDDVAVGVGGEGGILEECTIQPNVGGYISLTREVVQPDLVDTDRLFLWELEDGCIKIQTLAIEKAFFHRTLSLFKMSKFKDLFIEKVVQGLTVKQGSRRYSPLRQPTAQQVLIEKISDGPVSLFVIGAHANIAIFLITNPHLKKNVDHIYIMGGGVESKNPTGCCPENVNSTCEPQQCGVRGNIFTGYKSNPYAEFNIFGDPFAAYQVIHSGIPVTIVPLDATNTIPITQSFFEAFERNQHTFEAQYAFKSLKMVRDTWFDDQFYESCFMWDSFMTGIATSIMSNLHTKNGENEFAEVEYMNITVVTSNKPYGISDGSNSFFDGHEVPKFNLTKNGVHSGHVQTGIQDPFCLQNNGRCKEVLNKPDFEGKELGKIVVFDMDMSAGDFLALFYLLKVPVETINLKAILVTPTGWANAATIDVIYDLLHMMGRDDIIVGLGDSFGLNQSYPNDPSVGNCKYSKAIQHGSGGFLDSDTLFGLARDLPRSPRRYTAENFVEFGAPRTTDFPHLRQPLALEVWKSIVESVDLGSKITILTNGPLTTLAKIILADTNASSIIQDVFIVGGHIDYNKKKDKGNVFNVPINEYAELNMFLDPLAAKVVFESMLDITHSSWYATKDDTFLGEILGAVILVGDQQIISPTFKVKHLEVHATDRLADEAQSAVI
ncbi:inosine/uridine-preferring nucleoside hydrolase domain-containing protein, partial [Tanacetum coccineum]